MPLKGSKAGQDGRERNRGSGVHSIHNDACPPLFLAIRRASEMGRDD